VEAARLLVEKSCGLIDISGATRVPMTPEQRAMSKGEGSFTIDLLAKAGHDLMFLAGSGAFAEDRAVSRIWRDLNVGARHTANLPYVGYAFLVKSLLGIEPNISHPDFIWVSVPHETPRQGEFFLLQTRVDPFLAAAVPCPSPGRPRLLMRAGVSASSSCPARS